MRDGLRIQADLVPLVERKRDPRYSAIKKLRRSRLDVEIGIRSKQGAKSRPGGLTVVELAEIHEFGLGVPARPFLRGFFDAEQNKISRLLTATFQRIAKGEDPTRAAETLAVILEAMARKFVQDGRVEPDISEARKLQKGEDVPLIDTGILVNSITAKARFFRT